MALSVVETSQDIVMDATLNLDSQLSFWTVEVQNIWPNSVLTAKFHAKRRILQTVPKPLLCRCRVVAKLLPQRFLVGKIVDLFH